MRNFDNDSDGYDDDLDDFCPGLTGFSSQDRMGCPDSDGDGFSNPDSGWATSDGADAFVGDETQWSDFDGDGYGDNVGGFQPDSCPNQYGTSVNDRFGCLDGDSDGWSTPDSGWGVEAGADAFTTDPTQWADSDGDGFGDRQDGNNPDDCPDENGNSTEDRSGCIDSDGDGWSDPDESWGIEDGADAVPQVSTQRLDEDGDGYGDNSAGQYPDSCKQEPGNSTVDRYGCKDQDGDGVSDDGDKFKDDPTRWFDSDNDGLDDLLDDCKYSLGTSFMDRDGCIDSDGDGYSDPDQFWTTLDGADAFKNEVTQWTDSDGDGLGDNPDGADPDLCLETVVGEPVNDQGCSAIQRDTDNDGMNDAEDPCITSSANICRPNASGLAAIVWIAGTIALGYLGVAGFKKARGSDNSQIYSDQVDEEPSGINTKFTKVKALRAEGGMAEVHIAQDKESGTKVIWKQAAPHKKLTPEEANAALNNEIEVLKDLDHPRIPKFIDDGTVVNESGERVSVLVMEYIEGGSLDDEMKVFQKRNKLQDLEHTIETLLQCCEALEYMADLETPLYHRDIKPHNIMIHPKRGVVLIDFGLAKEVKAGDGKSKTAGAHTPDWAPPERTRADTGPYTDVYSLGQVLWHMLTNQPAGIFSEEKRIDTIAEAGHPKWLADLVQRSTVPDDPKKRIQTVTEFRMRLQNEGDMS